MTLALLLATALVGPPAPPSPTYERQQIVHIHQVADSFARTALVHGTLAAADLWTTGRCIRMNPRCVEQNPLGKSDLEIVAFKAAQVVGLSYLDYRLRRGGHHTRANVLRAVAAVGTGFLVVRNWRLATEGGR